MLPDVDPWTRFLNASFNNTSSSYSNVNAQKSTEADWTLLQASKLATPQSNSLGLLNWQFPEPPLGFAKPRNDFATGKDTFGNTNEGVSEDWDFEYATSLDIYPNEVTEEGADNLKLDLTVDDFMPLESETLVAKDPMDVNVESNFPLLPANNSIDKGVDLDLFFDGLHKEKKRKLETKKEELTVPQFQLKSEPTKSKPVKKPKNSLKSDTLIKDIITKEALVKSKGGSQVYRCQQCPDRIFKKRGLYVAHMRGHRGERPFVCTHKGCKAKYSRSDELSRHKRVHTGYKPHKCDMCNYSFARSDHLSMHRKTHFKKKKKKTA